MGFRFLQLLLPLRQYGYGYNGLMVRSRRRKLMHAITVSFFLLLCLISDSNKALAVYFDCDTVNEAKQCFCHPGDDFGWDIQCPATEKRLETFPISIKLISSTEKYDEASLRIICDPTNDVFNWTVVQGLDFGHENISFTINHLEMFYCPVIPTHEFQNLLMQMKLNPEKLRIFTFKSLTRNITSLANDFLITMPNLEFLNLQSNQLRKFPVLDGLIRLQGLNIRNNFIKTIPEGSFETNVILQNIGLSGNKMFKIDGNIFPESLTYLDLIDNQISTIGNESFSNLYNLRRLLLSRNPLQYLDDAAFDGLTDLVELYLDYSKSLSKISAIRNLPNLKNLSISFSTFSRPERDLSDRMGITEEAETEVESTTYGIQDDMMVYFETSEEVNTATATSSPIDPTTNTPTNFSGYLSLDPEDENKEITLAELPSLKILVLTDDKLKVVPALGYMPNLTSLVLSRNSIQSIPDEFFSQLPALVHADLNQNEISDLTEIQAPALTHLDLSNNKLRVLGKRLFRQLRKLEKLNLSRNKIEYVDPKAFESLVELREIDLSNNRLSFEHGSPLIPSFGIIDVDDSTMQPEVEEDHLSPLKFSLKLEKINLRNNLITKVYHDWTFMPSSLSFLDLSHNKIKIIHPRDLYFVSENVLFDLRHNAITTVDMDFADLLLEPYDNKKIVVQFDGNPLNCDCHTLSFKDFAVKTYLLEHNDLRCYSPENLKNKLFNDVSDGELVCEIEENCPEKCTCIEIPSDNLIKVNCSSKTDFVLPDFSNFTYLHETSEIELDLGSTHLTDLNENFVQNFPSQVRQLNLSDNNLSSLDSVKAIAFSNNFTKFSLADNPFRCDDCHFQQIWWELYDRISDIKNVTCVTGIGPKGSMAVISFEELVKDTVCVEEILTEEMRWCVILVGVLIPILLLIIVLCNKQKRAKALKAKKVPDKLAKPKRIPIAELDITKF